MTSQKKKRFTEPSDLESSPNHLGQKTGAYGEWQDRSS